MLLRGNGKSFELSQGSSNPCGIFQFKRSQIYTERRKPQGWQIKRRPETRAPIASSA